MGDEADRRVERMSEPTPRRDPRGRSAPPAKRPSEPGIAMPEARNRKPTGKPAWPRILLSGEEGAHKSTTAAKLSADDRIGGMYWLEVGAGENTADEYGAIDGVNYDLIDHDGTWADIYGQVCAHWQLAKDAEDRGDLPTALVVDAGHGVYGMLLEWGDVLARRRLEKQIRNDRRDNRNPADAWNLETEAQKQPDIWNSINRRWNQFMAKVLTWPGPVVLIAAEKLVTPFVNGQPDPKAPKEWTMDGSPKTLPRQCTSWVRMTRDNPPAVVKLRSAREANAVAAGEDRPVTRPNFTCATLIFDWVGCESGVSRAPRHVELDADQTMPGEGDEPGSSSPRGATASATAEKPAAGLLNATTKDRAGWWAGKVDSNGDSALDATPYVTDDDRGVLGDRLAAGKVTLGQLAAAVTGYWDKHASGPRQDPSSAGEPASGEKAAASP